MENWTTETITVAKYPTTWFFFCLYSWFEKSWEASCGNRNMSQLVTLYHCQEAELCLQGELGCKSLRPTDRAVTRFLQQRLYFLKVSTVLENSTTSSGPSPWTRLMCKPTPCMYIALPSSGGKPNWRFSQFHSCEVCRLKKRLQD